MSFEGAPKQENKEDAAKVQFEARKKELHEALEKAGRFEDLRAAVHEYVVLGANFGENDFGDEDATGEFQRESATTVLKAIEFAQESVHTEEAYDKWVTTLGDIPGDRLRRKLDQLVRKQVYGANTETGQQKS